MDVTFNFGLLREKIKNDFSTQENFADALGIGRTSLNQRLNNVSEFSSKEILKSCELLSISREDIPVYFFTPIVQKHEQ
jgi:hypothetical protein